MGAESAYRKIRSLLRKASPSEVHWAARGRRCPRCGGPPVIEVLIFAPTLELVRESPQAAMRLAAQNEGTLPITQLRGVSGEPLKFTKIFQEFACAHHRQELEHLAAKAPSSHFVDIRRGPAKDRPLVQVAG